MGVVCATRVAVCLVVLGLPASPTAAQDVPQFSAATPGEAWAGSATSLQRIRRALALTPPGGLLNLHEYVHVIAEEPDDLSLFGDFDFLTGPTPYGAPVHFEMHGLAPPMGAIYSHSVDTAVLALIARARRAIAGLFTAEDEPAPGVPPLLRHAEREQALAQITGHPTVMDATLHQRGRTVTLELVVPATTPVATARQVGDDFVQMATALASAAPAPGAGIRIRASDYDYIIGVRTPTDAKVAVGAKTTGSPRITW